MKKIDSFEYGTLIWFLIRACFIVSSASLIISISDEESWFSIIIGTLIGIIPFLIYEYLKRNSQTKTLLKSIKNSLENLDIF